MDLNDLRYFALTVKHGGFSAAGRASRIPKSKLSRRVAALESYLGARLLQRTTRKLSLTEAGRAFYEHAAAMLVEAESAERAVESLKVEPVGTVRLSCPSAVTQFLMAELVAEFMRLHPKVRVELESSDRVINLIDEGVDVVLRTRPGGLDDPGLTARRVSSGKLVLVASKNFSLAYPQIDPASGQINVDTIGIFNLGQEQTWTLQDKTGSLKRILVRPRLLCSDYISQFHAAVGGIGVALLPERVAAVGIAQRSLLRLAPTWSTAEQDIFVVFVTRRGLLPSVRAMIDFLVARVPVALTETDSR